MRINRLFVLIVLSLTLLLTTGCGKNNNTPTPSGSNGSMNTMDHSTMKMDEDSNK